MMHWWGYPGQYGGFGLFSLLHMLFWVAILVGGFLLIRSYLNNNPRIRLGSEADSREILRQRYAKGEISKEEYLKMKKDLEE